MGFFDRMNNKIMPIHPIGGGAGAPRMTQEGEALRLLNDERRRNAGRKDGGGYGNIPRRNPLSRIPSGPPVNAAGWDEQMAVAMGAGRTGAPIGTDGKPMDVVYDQRPEIAAKELDLRKRQLYDDQKQQGIQNERQMREDLLKGDAYERDRRMNLMTDREKANTEIQARLQDEGMRHRNRMELETAENKAAMEREKVGNQSAAERQAANEAAYMERQRVEGEQRTGQIDQQARHQKELVQSGGYTPRTPTQATEATKYKARQFLNENPDMGDLLSFDDDGNPVVAPPPTRKEGGWFGMGGSTVTDKSQVDRRRRVMDAIYGTGNMNLVDGVGSAALGTNVGQLGVPKSDANPVNQQRRERAIELLKKQNRRMTEAAIQETMKRLNN